MPQLDSLRALAVLFVLFEHWIPDGSSYKVLPFGMIGVTVFFVLSGFLITDILLNSRKIAAVKNKSIFHSLKQFYIRRTLRIFPVYYITLLILIILNFQNVREIYVWFLTYTSNIYFFSVQKWAGSLSHLWTLAVEEQFYIFWPFLIFFIPERFLSKSVYAIISFGVLFRAVMFLLSDKSEVAVNFTSILTPSCLDAFGLGALLSFLRLRNNNFQFTGRKSFYFFTSCFILIPVMITMNENIFTASLFKFVVSAMSLLLISRMSTGFSGILKPVFENKILVYLGKISYGLYLFHNFIPSLYAYFKFPEPQNTIQKFLIYSALLTVVASVSWFVLERPVNNLKRKFAYN